MGVDNSIFGGVHKVIKNNSAQYDSAVFPITFVRAPWCLHGVLLCWLANATYFLIKRNMQYHRLGSWYLQWMQCFNYFVRNTRSIDKTDTFSWKFIDSFFIQANSIQRAKCYFNSRSCLLRFFTFFFDTWTNRCFNFKQCDSMYTAK